MKLITAIPSKWLERPAPDGPRCAKWLERPAPGRLRSVSLRLFLLLSLFFYLPNPLHAAEAADPAQKLQAQLRAALLQVRAAQTETSNAQAEKAAAEKKNADLTAKTTDLEKRLETLAKQSNADKAAADETIAKLNTRITALDKLIGQYKEALEKCKTDYQQAAGLARSKEEERAKLAAEILVHQRTIADRERKNIALFNTAIEILDRFQNYALGKALQAREPFIGTTRVKVENLVQGYKDRILDNRIAAPARKP